MKTKKTVCEEYKCFNTVAEDIDTMLSTMGIEHVCILDRGVSTFLFEVEDEKEGQTAEDEKERQMKTKKTDRR